MRMLHEVHYDLGRDVFVEFCNVMSFVLMNLKETGLSSHKLLFLPVEASKK